MRPQFLYIRDCLYHTPLEYAFSGKIENDRSNQIARNELMLPILQAARTLPFSLAAVAWKRYFWVQHNDYVKASKEAGNTDKAVIGVFRQLGVDQK